MPTLKFRPCRTCEDEPMTDLPPEVREKVALWAFWRFHTEAHELGREVLRSVARLLGWNPMNRRP
jgi:hypothetical protein